MDNAFGKGAFLRMANHFSSPSAKEQNICFGIYLQPIADVYGGDKVVQRTDCGERQTEILILVLLQVSV
jgi:hypothetical protein